MNSIHCGVHTTVVQDGKRMVQLYTYSRRWYTKVVQYLIPGILSFVKMFILHYCSAHVCIKCKKQGPTQDPQFLATLPLPLSFIFYHVVPSKVPARVQYTYYV